MRYIIGVDCSCKFDDLRGIAILRADDGRTLAAIVYTKEESHEKAMQRLLEEAKHIAAGG